MMNGFHCQPVSQIFSQPLDEFEHRPLMNERFPQWADAIEYWLVHDIDKTSASVALGQIEQHILQLIEQLAQS
ncbi:hypothetical protein [Nostoc sp. KVJ3]|uniref:hypothetical protein n=1 Tax=Nostoc sp. KVJ3 TaxID=457945 RepID=UPI002237A1DE|nr:hypothetical protein [Nostoc sp. KVJ3]